MNAARQRQLTPVLGVLSVLAALTWLALVFGVGRTARWPAHGPAAPLPAEAVPAGRAPPPLAHFASIWQKPLFNPGRTPETAPGTDGQPMRLGDLELTGIILTPDLRMALLRDRQGHGVRVREGARLPDGTWTLRKLEPRSAIFTGNGQRTELTLKVAGRNDAQTGLHAHGASSGKPRPGTFGAPPVRAGPHQAPHRPILHLKPPAQQQPSPSRADLAAGQRAKQARIQKLKARIQARRRQLQANPDQEH